MRKLVAAITLLSLTIGACKSGNSRALASQTDGAQTAGRSLPSSDEEGLSVGKTEGAATPAAVNALANPLPPLKPIHRKPFPVDVPQDVLCEAINSTESDLWVRFGHLLPLYMRGAIYVLQSDVSKEPAIKHFVTDEYARPHFPQLASCGDKALLYVGNIFEESMFGNKPFGRLHLARDLERRLGIKTLESFMIEDGDGNARLSDYCRQDGEICDALHMLNFSNEGLGICGHIIREPKQPNDPEYRDAMRRCRAAPKNELACKAFINTSPDEQTECWKRVSSALDINE